MGNPAVLMLSLLIIIIVCIAGIMLVIIFMQALKQPIDYASQVSTHGTVSTTVGLETNTTAIEWGMLNPGDNTTIAVEVSNVGTKPVILSLQTSNYIPANAVNYLTLSWNYNNETIQTGTSISVQLMLTVGPSIEGINDFSFNITITGD